MTQDRTPGTSPAGDRQHADADAGEEPFWQNSMAATLQVDPGAPPDFKRAIPAALLAVFALLVGVRLNGPTPDQPQSFNLFGWQFTLATGWITLIDLVCLVVFLAAGGVAARTIWRELQRVAARRAGPAAGQAVRLVCTITAGLALLIGTFAILQLDLRSLLLGSAVTGVIIGIAAQQTLNNFFAGLVLFFARPYVAGQRVKIRAGSMGGPFTGVIVGAGMMYTVIQTDDEGLISMPNAGLMAAAIGPDPAMGVPQRTSGESAGPSGANGPAGAGGSSGTAAPGVVGGADDHDASGT